MGNEYESVLDKARKLSVVERLRLLSELAISVQTQVDEKKEHSILELKGLGKEVWNGCNVKSYINEERDSWSG